MPNLAQMKAALSALSPELRNFLEPSAAQMRLYHGTTATEKGGEALKTLKPSKEGSLGSGVYLTPKPDFSGEYAKGLGGNILPVYAQIRNPLILTGEHSHDPMVEAMVKLGHPVEKAQATVDKLYEDRGYVGKHVQTKAMSQGYDGIMQYHPQTGELKEVLPFNSTQVKSAISNTGEYSPYSNLLSKADGGLIYL